MSKYPDILGLIEQELSVSRRRVNQILQNMEKESGYTLTRNDAIMLLASKLKIDIRSFLRPDDLKRLRDLLSIQPITIQQKPQKRTKTYTQKVINLSNSLQISDPLLPNLMLTEVIEMAKVYPIIYVFENSVRNVIKVVMEKTYGKNWWHSKAPSKVQKDVAGRKATEGRNPWHGKRGNHEIFYTNIGNLESIITANWKDFRDLFPSQSWIKTRIEEIELSRNIVAHNNPLSKRDRDRINMYFEDWKAQVLEIKKKI